MQRLHVRHGPIGAPGRDAVSRVELVRNDDREHVRTACSVQDRMRRLELAIVDTALGGPVGPHGLRALGAATLERRIEPGNASTAAVKARPKRGFCAISRSALLGQNGLRGRFVQTNAMKTLTGFEAEYACLVVWPMQAVKVLLRISLLVRQKPVRRGRIGVNGLSAQRLVAKETKPGLEPVTQEPIALAQTERSAFVSWPAVRTGTNGWTGVAARSHVGSGFASGGGDASPTIS